MYDFTNSEDVETAKAVLTTGVDASLVCEFLEIADILDEDPAYELDEFLAGWIKAKRPQVGRTISTSFGADEPAPFRPSAGEAANYGAEG